MDRDRELGRGGVVVEPGELVRLGPEGSRRQSQMCERLTQVASGPEPDASTYSDYAEQAARNRVMKTAEARGTHAALPREQREALMLLVARRHTMNAQGRESPARGAHWVAVRREPTSGSDSPMPGIEDR